MGAHKHGSKGGSGGGGGGYVGGFLHLFDWNAKSRKKLFSSKSESPEQPKQTKRTDGNMPMTRFHMMDEDDTVGGLSLKGSSDYSCATSVTDEDGYGTKAPGVVARLMGLDSLPTSTFLDTYSNASFELEFERNACRMDAVARAAEPKPPKMVIGKAIEKFQTETLPPKSAKSIPITRHKLLSPIKNSGFVSSSNAARIMEAASKIPLVGSSSSSSSPSSSVPVPFKVKVPKEKIENPTRKPKISEPSRRQLESNAAKNLKGQQSLEPKKTISLALQAKANVQRREGLKTQPNTERNQRKNSTCSSVLKQNNQKQNGLVDRGKSTPKSSGSSNCSQTRKPVSQKSSSKISENSRISHKKEPYSITRRKRSIEDIDRNHAEKNVVRDRSSRSSRSDVVSFTFTAPIARPVISTNGFLSGKNMLDAPGTALKSPSLSYNFIGGDALSTLLEQKLRELTCNPTSVSQDSLAATGTDTRDDPLQLIKGYCCQQPSPVSVLEPSCLTESCNSSDTVDSCKPSLSSVQAQERVAASFSSKPSPMDVDTELTDSASSIATHHTTWESDYVKDVLADIETMLVDFTLGKTRKIVNPRVFDWLECGRPKQDAARLRRELVFGCVSECMDRRCRVWAKGLAGVRRPDQLAKQVYKEITRWEEMKDSMVDELVDMDMSAGPYGKWLDFDVEAFELGVAIEGGLLNTLIDEVVDDILEL